MIKDILDSYDINLDTFEFKVKVAQKKAPKKTVKKDDKKDDILLIEAKELIEILYGENSKLRGEILRLESIIKARAGYYRGVA
jgi:hypothetical protein